jgi:hypothetical protein
VTISRVAANWNGGNGISVFGENARIENSTTDHNVGDGIWLNWPGIVTGNHTWFNGNLGIEAAPGTLGSANWAKHNRNPLQCVPVYLCSTMGKPKR